MYKPSFASEIVLEVAKPGAAPEFVPVTHTPFLLGRGSESGNDLALEDPRISRTCAAIVSIHGEYRVEDRGQRQGIHVNGIKVQQKKLEDGDVINFGLEDSYRITFHSSLPRDSVESMLTRLGSIATSSTAPGAGGLSKLNLLLEATSLLSSSLPLESVLSTMLDHAISITRADRGLLLEPDEDGTLKVRLARRTGGTDLPVESITPSHTALRQAIQQHAPVITDDLSLAGLDLKTAESVVIQGLRAVVAIPLFAVAHASSEESQLLAQSQLLGAVYLDSRSPAAFSNLDRQILDALGSQAASILDNARLVERERERQRMEQELEIGRQIQQGLLPHGLRDFPHLELTSVLYPCQEVGGDYFDVFPLSDDRTAFLVADVAGKGLGAALLTTMLQGALTGMTLGVEPVKVVSHINRLICDHAAVDRFVTMFFAIVDHAGNMEYIHAGHPSPLLLRADTVSELYTEGSFPVGVLEEAEFTSHRAQLEPGDTLVLFTDGIPEAQDPKRELFGDPRLREVVEGGAYKPIQELQATILRAVDEFCRGAEASDDVTLLIVRYRNPVQQ
ncbi:MAG TPA: SpoIIE family protein phosphatase [Terracidiphilus sp.]|jgi:serine phosphatase RsbU (regulator of sigma subunit)|nr:SpoIIE family protein phosphatase [Terracidiphilus sp.]